MSKEKKQSGDFAGRLIHRFLVSPTGVRRLSHELQISIKCLLPFSQELQTSVLGACLKGESTFNSSDVMPVNLLYMNSVATQLNESKDSFKNLGY